MSVLSIGFASYMLSYLLLSLTGVWITYYLMSRVFENRHAPVVWWAYFVVKNTVNGLTLIALELGAEPWLKDVEAIELSVTSVLSLLVMFYTWKGDYVEVAFCAVVSDTFAAVTTVMCRLLSNTLLGYPLSRGWITPFDLTTILEVMIRVLVCLALSRPLAAVLRFVRRLAMRHHLVASCIVAGFIVYSVTSFYIPVFYMNMSVQLAFMQWPLLFVVLGAGLFTLRRARDMSRRDQVLDECMHLAQEYDTTVREQLATLNADRIAIEGHERSLTRLKEGEADDTLVERIRLLERTYQRLSAGNYCNQPALDAVLSAGAQRLRQAGVRCEITVAGLPSQGVDPAMAALALLNVAGETVERVGHEGTGNPVVDLRVRGLGEQVLLRMEVPVSWGPLGVRRSLSTLYREGEELIMERRRGESNVVLMLTSEEAQ